MNTIRFNTELSKVGSQIVVSLPKSVSEKMPSEETMIEGIINFFPFRATLNSNDKGTYFIVNKAMQEAAKVNIGDTVPVEITRVGYEPEVRIPLDLQKGLNENSEAKAQWEKITPMARRDWILSICTVKKVETRVGRIEKTFDMLAHGKGRVCCFPGIAWIMKGHEEAGIWLKLGKV